MARKSLPLSVYFAQVLYIVIVGLLVLLPDWPMQWWWLANLLSIAPLWVWLLPLLFFFRAAVMYKDRRMILVNSMLFLVLIFGVMGFKVPLPSAAGVPVAAQPFSVKIVTANLGHISELEPFLRLLTDENPDVIVFQELEPQYYEELKAFLHSGGWFLEGGGPGLATRMKIRSVDAVDRRSLGGWGNLVVKYELESPVGLLYVFAVHLATPREGVQAFIGREKDALMTMQKITSNQNEESLAASNFAAQFRPVLVAGDFNLTEFNPIFRAYWSRYQDAFARRGLGFGFTKHTHWHGARIDHILYDPFWKVTAVRVGPDVGGDHHPLIAQLVFIGPKDLSPVPKVQMSLPGAVSAPAVSRGDLNFSGVTVSSWDLDTFPHVSFSYLVQPGTPLSLRVKTQWGDWLCLGGTSSADCPSAKTGPQVTLTDDGDWHKADLDVRSAVQSVLPAVRALTDFQFLLPEEKRSGVKFRIDEFRIFGLSKEGRGRPDLAD